MLTVNTSINNLKLQRNLSTANFAAGKALERLSTGRKINNASDDAAGLVISTALNVQTRGLNVANQNAQMAANVLNTADLGLNALGDLTMRIRDLATQAANGGYSTAERNALALESTELSKSMAQIVEGAKFNEFKLFEGTAKSIITEEEAIAQGYTVIKTADELNTTLNADDALNNSSKKIILMEDIDLSAIPNWTAIGTSSSNSFKGEFDGNGFTISNLTIDKSSDYQGLFGYINGAKIKNVKIENADVKSTGMYAGVLAGYALGSNITNCSASGNVIGNSRVGGLVGYASGSTISNSCAMGSVTGGNYTGGLVGYANSSTTSNSYATANVTGMAGTGGLVGEATRNSVIKNSCATGNVTGRYYAGGFVGFTDLNSDIVNCWARGNVYSAPDASESSTFGSFVGYAYGGIVSNCFSAGQNLATVGRLGGFAGRFGGDAIFTNNNFITQTSGIGATESGAATDITEQPSSYFTPALTQSTLNTGSEEWNFKGPTPRLKWQIKPPSPNELTFQIGVNGSALSALTINTGFSINAFSADLSTADSARVTMVNCDTLLRQINAKRGEIGASISIVGSIVEGNAVTNENLSASKSRIMDADIARESANMIKNQILENAIISLMVQSKNVNGQLALQLLGGLS